MQSLAHLQNLIDKVPPRLESLGPQKAALKPAPGKWSPKEELGHLLDSAANNHQRIVHVQITDKLSLPGYQQNQWVEIHGYQHREWSELIALWTALNRQLLAAAKSVPDAAWKHTCTIGDSEALTLWFIFEDYIQHMRHHLEHIGIKTGDLASLATEK